MAQERLLAVRAEDAGGRLVSVFDTLKQRPPEEQAAIVAQLSREEQEQLLYKWEYWRRDDQTPPAGSWRIWLLLSGRGFGKTRVGAEWIREQVKHFQQVNLIGPTAADYRDVMIEGESGILAVCPKAERPAWYPSRRVLEWPNGAKSLCFSAEDPEQLRGPQHQRLWMDELAAWSSHTRTDTFDLAMFGLRLPPDPRCLITTTPKPVPILRQMVEDALASVNEVPEGAEPDDRRIVVTRGSTYDNRANLDPEFFNSIIQKYEGTRLGRQELEAELLLDEGLAYRLIDGIHVIPRFGLPDTWTRFEAMDYGTSAPTSWGCFAVDTNGLIVAHGLYHSPGYPSDHAAAIHKLRAQKWWAKDSYGAMVPATCFAPQDIKTRFGRHRITGKEMSPETEFADYGITFATAQQDRRAGYIRIAELLKCDDHRPFPDWHPRRGQTGAPRFYIVDSEDMQPLITAMRDAIIEDVDSPLSRFPGEAVDQEWESREGHAHAMLRYALMSRPKPADRPGYIADPMARTVRDLWGRKPRKAAYET